MNPEIKKYLAEIGTKGGKANKGKPERKKICRRAARARWKRVKAAKQLTNAKGNENFYRL